MVRRILGHVSAHHAYDQAVRRFIDENDITGSSDVVSAVFESRLDSLEDSNLILDSSISSLSSSLSSSVQDIVDIEASVSSLSSSLSASIYNVSVISSSLTQVSSSVSSLQSLYTALSQSVQVLSASIGSGGGLSVDIDDDAELWFDGDTLLTNADVYISGSGNNLYIHGTNESGSPAKYEFSVVSGSTFIKEVPHTDFGAEVSDPWFKFDGDTLLTHADIYVSGSNNYLYLNGTNTAGDYALFYFDIVSGSVIIRETGSI